MHRWRWLAMCGAIALAACVKQTDYDAHIVEYNNWKASVQKSGSDVDGWIKAAHEVVKWVSDNGDTFCPSCTPPTPPPSPPPDGQW